ncbi:MAG: PAS domain S-box protein, partial [Anaerolineales bacterium]|nr:PAS domain S-box protein [Anaerolineales bacterium]
MAKSSIPGQTDSQLQESEKKYRQLIDTLQEGVWLIDKDANTTFVNPRMAEMLGYTVEEMLGQYLFAFIDEKNKELMQRKLQRRRQGIKESYDFEFICKDGHTIYVTLASSPIMDESGNYQGAIAVVTDVTERRLAEETLRESEERFRVTYENAPVGITHVSPEGKWLHVNRHLCEMVGYSRKELLQRTFKDITYPDDLEADLKLLYQLLASEITTYSMEKRYVHKNGSLVWVNLTVTPVRDTTGEVKYIIGIIEDINERKQAEEALRQSEERFRTLVNSMDDIIFTLDREGRHTDVFGHWVEKAGLTPEVFLGKTVQEVLGNEAAIVHEAANQRALNGEN